MDAAKSQKQFCTTRSAPVLALTRAPKFYICAVNIWIQSESLHAEIQTNIIALIIRAAFIYLEVIRMLNA
jgi:hypothetical protein